MIDEAEGIKVPVIVLYNEYTKPVYDAYRADPLVKGMEKPYEMDCIVERVEKIIKNT